MTNFNNPNNRFQPMPNYNGSSMPYSYGNHINGNMGYPNTYTPYTQNNGFNQQPQQINDMPIQVRFVTQKEAEGFIVYPNSTILLIDKMNGMAHLKTANNLGESTTQVFKFMPFNGNDMNTAPSGVTPQNNINTENFVTKTDLQKLNFATKEQLKMVLDKVETLRKKFIGEESDGNK